MAETVNKDQIIDGLVSRLVNYSHGIEPGSLVAHKTDLDLENIYVVTEVKMDLSTEEIFLQCANNSKGVHHDGVTFRLIEMILVNAPQPVEE